jgi:hypothetical protein
MEKEKTKKYETRSIWELVMGWKDAPQFYTRVKVYEKPRTFKGKINGTIIY